jgi:hypothetical protein
MTDPQQAAADAAEAAARIERAVALFAPNATNVEIGTVNQTERQIQITDFRADLPDGTRVHAPYLSFQRGMT